jgi:Tfp pilus assembly protein PilN
MDKIKINLLPPEIKEKAKKEAKQSLINKISIALLGVLILITSSILAVVIFQGATVNLLNTEIENEKSRIQSQKDTEAIVFLLKNRIDTINQFTNKRYKQREVFDLITSLFPQGVALKTVLIDKTTKVVVVGQTDNTFSLQAFFDNLTDPQTNEGKIANVTVESLNNNQPGKINFELSVNLDKGALQ